MKNQNETQTTRAASPHYHAEWAATIASEAHHGQKDKAGNPLFWHLHDVASIIKGKGFPEIYEVVAWLHDLIEDGTDSGQRMATESLDRMTGRALPFVRALTRAPGEMYFDYIKRVAAHSRIAVAVKIADLEDHLNKSADIPPSLVKRYEKALQILTR